MAFAIGPVRLSIVVERTADQPRIEHRLTRGAPTPTQIREKSEGGERRMVNKMSQKNLETILLDYLGAIRAGDEEVLRDLLDPHVTWQGLREEWVCHGPDEVIETLEQAVELRRDIVALEFIR